MGSAPREARSTGQVCATRNAGSCRPALRASPSLRSVSVCTVWIAATKTADGGYHLAAHRSHTGVVQPSALDASPNQFSGDPWKTQRESEDVESFAGKSSVPRG